MPFPNNLNSFGHLNEAITHYNSALDKIENNGSNIEICRSLFDCLNKIQTEYIRSKQLRIRRESDAFSTMIKEIFEENPESVDIFLKSRELQSFSDLSPPILDHYVLRNGEYYPNQEIPRELANRASEKHRVLKQLLKKYSDNLTTSDELLNQTSRLLYTVRSNIAHGEKPPDGPDIQKIERDNLVSEVTIPLQLLLIDLLLKRPSHLLVTYGALSPNEVNHSVLSQISGIWDNCSILGIQEKNELGLPVFKWDLTGNSIDVHLFLSDMLPDKWQSLDKLVGYHYKRRLIPVQGPDQKNQIANIYLEKL